MISLSFWRGSGIISACVSPNNGCYKGCCRVMKRAGSPIGSPILVLVAWPGPWFSHWFSHFGRLLPALVPWFSHWFSHFGSPFWSGPALGPWFSHWFSHFGSPWPLPLVLPLVLPFWSLLTRPCPWFSHWFSHFAVTPKSHSRCGFYSICCVSGAWRAPQNRILAAVLSHLLCFRRLAGTPRSHSRCGSIAFVAFQALGGHPKIAFSLRFYSICCVSGAWWAPQNRILAAVL